MAVNAQEVWDKASDIEQQIIKRGAWHNALSKTNCYTSLIQVRRDLDISHFDLTKACKNLQSQKVVGDLLEGTMFGFMDEKDLGAFKEIVPDPPIPSPTYKERILAVIEDSSLSDDEKANKIVGNTI